MAVRFVLPPSKIRLNMALSVLAEGEIADCDPELPSPDAREVDFVTTLVW